MKIEYENTIDDYVAFQLFHDKHSAAARRQLRLWTYIPPIILLMFWIFTLIMRIIRGFNTFTIVYLIVVFVFIVFWLVFFPTLSRGRLKNTGKKMYTEKAGNAVSIKNALTLTPDEIVVTSGQVELKNKWNAINDIAENNSFIFIYTSPYEAKIIPKPAFKDQSELSSFIDLAKHYKEQSSQ